MRTLRQVWVMVSALAYIPSNLRRGYSLREQYGIVRLAVRVEGL